MSRTPVDPTHLYTKHRGQVPREHLENALNLVDQTYFDTVEQAIAAFATILAEMGADYEGDLAYLFPETP